MRIRIGTRGSKLALAQTTLVIEALGAAHPGLDVELCIIQTEGDRRRRASLLAIGGQGVFTRELEVVLLDGEIDVAVHSLKDLPSTLPEGLVLAATPPREDPRDVLVTQDGTTLDELPEGTVVGTGSLRRRTQLLRLRPDLQMKDIRGNVDTRLAKLDMGEYDAIVLAAAGLSRLGALGRVKAEVLAREAMLPAPAQGILGLECRADDTPTREALATLNHAPTFVSATAERAVLSHFGIGCRLPVAALAETEGDTLRLRARVLSADGRIAYDAETRGPWTDAERLGEAATRQLIEAGALALLESLEVAAEP
ncbi:MAG TPA: hydroxymethylbilane synthase [Ardenticatenaceae bacterium]